jgi:hypothetical protein
LPSAEGQHHEVPFDAETNWLDPVSLNRIIHPARDCGLSVITVHTRPGTTHHGFHNGMVGKAAFLAQASPFGANLSQ